jgi:hypothetical protein
MIDMKRRETKNKKTSKKTSTNTIIEEYSLKQSSFNPKKPSPNLFIKKLEIRMKMYYRDLYKSYN